MCRSLLGRLSKGGTLEGPAKAEEQKGLEHGLLGCVTQGKMPFTWQFFQTALPQMSPSASPDYTGRTGGLDMRPRAEFFPVPSLTYHRPGPHFSYYLLNRYALPLLVTHYGSHLPGELGPNSPAWFSVPCLSCPANLLLLPLGLCLQPS